MAKTQFTPGPWHVVLSDNATPHIMTEPGSHESVDNDAAFVCVMPAEIIRSYNSLANARLIASAPEMYEALEKEYELLLFANGYSDADIDIHGKTQTSRIKRVLAKARGES